MSEAVSGKTGHTLAPLPARLGIDAGRKRIRRYAKNAYGRVFLTDEWEVLDWAAASAPQLADLLARPR